MTNGRSIFLYERQTKMAGTIISTPVIGASSWVDFITQQSKTDKGFLRVSLTNPATTAASSIGTGSVMELAGSIYQFTETSITLAAGTPSAAQAVYYTVIPSAGGTTVTVVMEGTAPTWIDSKQGFYASAASTTRYIGGSYINAGGGYDNKFIYTPQMLDYLIYQNETRPILKKILEIGEWNMNSTTTTTILHGLIVTKIKRIYIIIRNDANNIYQGLDIDDGTNGPGGRYEANLTAIVNVRFTGRFFDGIAFDGTASTVANRGFIFIEYEA